MHDSYLITEISQYRHIDAKKSLRPIVAGRWRRAGGGTLFMEAAGRYRDDAAAAAEEEEEEGWGGEEERRGEEGEQREGGVQTVSPRQLVHDERRRRCLSFPAERQETCTGDLRFA